MTGPGTILQVEDDDNDILFLRAAMQKAAPEIPLQVAIDGKQALDYLQGNGKYANRDQYPIPCLVLLDLRLPRVDGFRVLEWIRQQPQYRALPVVIMTSSNEECDIDRARQLGANAYITKPANPAELVGIIQSLRHYCIPGEAAPPEIPQDDLHTGGDLALRPVPPRANVSAIW
jgi:CheY-like chemotaxis protein